MSNQNPIRKPRTLIETLLEDTGELFELTEEEERMLFGGLVVNQIRGEAWHL